MTDKNEMPIEIWVNSDSKYSKEDGYNALKNKLFEWSVEYTQKDHMHAQLDEVLKDLENIEVTTAKHHRQFQGIWDKLKQMRGEK